MFRNAKTELAPVGAILLGVGLVVFGASAIGAYSEALRVPGVGAGFYEHASNFGITYLVVALLCVVRLFYGASRTELTITSVVILIVVTVYELWGWLNTPDCVDVAFGAAGAVLGYLTALAICSWGLRPRAKKRRG